ncbi:TIM barrel protein [Nitratireductor sp. ZSWI3]|uniref:TIM barrel protein n=1 Tax=Nitratireductor sp. ZSWI3 TaxID=2966359 RepID=UPI0021502A3F|nr:TIM barrel protein [Nitratireductor sp. ZSWI3]MCR4269005.1 TIM barrel protein [Nitratireductor sp. ZSWI3]
MSATTPFFALNHMSAPQLSITDFFDLAADLGVGGVEIRNDLAGNAIEDGTSPVAVRQAAEARDLRILSINALQRFNDWTPERAAEAEALIAYAGACGAEALVLVPVNDGSGRANGERQANLRIALKALRPVLEAAGIIGLVEPLGFESCSLRSKSEAVEAIVALGAEDRFRLVHDTFHHCLAGEETLFVAHTGLVHISSVDDASISLREMRDGHRVLVGDHDRLGNAEQISALLEGGYRGLFSFEPFSDSVHRAADPRGALRDSMAHILEKTGIEKAARVPA